MKKLLVSGLCALCISPAMADDTKSVRPYFGVNISFNFPDYSSRANDIANWIDLSFPSNHIGLGFETGIKFDNNNKKVVQGFSFAYDYIVNKSMSIRDLYISKAEIGFSAWNISFDNYIKMSKDEKVNLVFGIGLGQATERLRIVGTDYYDVTDFNIKAEGDVVVLKFGTNIQLDKDIDWYTILREIIPVDKADIKSMLSIQTGIKFNF